MSDKLSFSRVEIGDVLLVEKPVAKVYYFIYDRTPTRIYFSTYEFKGEIGIFERSDRDEHSFNRSLMSDAKVAPKGDLVKQLLMAKDIKNI